MSSDAYYSWREGSFSLDILLYDGGEPNSIEIGDSIVTLPSGIRYSVLMLTLEEIARIMDRHRISGESLNGTYFCTPDLVVIKGAGVSLMVDVVRDIVKSGEMSTTLPAISDDGGLNIPST